MSDWAHITRTMRRTGGFAGTRRSEHDAYFAFFDPGPGPLARLRAGMERAAAAAGPVGRSVFAVIRSRPASATATGRSG